MSAGMPRLCAPEKMSGNDVICALLDGADALGDQSMSDALEEIMSAAGLRWRCAAPARTGAVRVVEGRTVCEARDPRGECGRANWPEWTHCDLCGAHRGFGLVAAE